MKQNRQILPNKILLVKYDVSYTVTTYVRTYIYKFMHKISHSEKRRILGACRIIFSIDKLYSYNKLKKYLINIRS